MAKHLKEKHSFREQREFRRKLPKPKKTITQRKERLIIPKETKNETTSRVFGENTEM